MAGVQTGVAGEGMGAVGERSSSAGERTVAEERDMTGSGTGTRTEPKQEQSMGTRQEPPLLISNHSIITTFFHHTLYLATHQSLNCLLAHSPHPMTLISHFPSRICHFLPPILIPVLCSPVTLKSLIPSDPGPWSEVLQYYHNCYCPTIRKLSTHQL